MNAYRGLERRPRTTVVHPAVIYSAARLYIRSHTLPPISISPFFDELDPGFYFVPVKSFHPSQHDIRRYIKRGVDIFSFCFCCWSGGNVSIESKETDRPNGIVERALLFQRTNETPLSVLAQRIKILHGLSGQQEKEKRPSQKLGGLLAC